MKHHESLLYAMQQYYPKFSPNFADIEANRKVSPLTLTESLSLLDRSGGIENRGIMLYAYLLNRKTDTEMAQEYYSKILEYIEDDLPGYDGYRIGILAAQYQDLDLFANALEKLDTDDKKKFLLEEILTTLGQEQAETFLNFYQDELGTVPTHIMADLSSAALKNLLVISISDRNSHPEIMQSLPFVLQGKEIKLTSSEAQEIYQRIDFSNIDNLPFIGILSNNFASIRGFEGELEAQVIDMINDNPEKAQDVLQRIYEYFPSHYSEMLEEKIIESGHITTTDILAIHGIDVSDIMTPDSSKLQQAENFLKIYSSRNSEPFCKAALEKFYEEQIRLHPQNEQDQTTINQVQNISGKVLSYMLNRDDNLSDEATKPKKVNKLQNRNALYNPDAVLMLDLEHLNSMYKVYTKVEEQSQKYFSSKQRTFGEFIEAIFAKIKLFFERYEVSNEAKKDTVETLDKFFLIQTNEKAATQLPESNRSSIESILEKGVERSKQTAAHRITKYLDSGGGIER